MLFGTDGKTDRLMDGQMTGRKDWRQYPWVPVAAEGKNDQLFHVLFLPYSEISSKSVNTFFINIANRHKLSGSRWWSGTVPSCVTFNQGMSYLHYICNTSIIVACIISNPTLQFNQYPFIYIPVVAFPCIISALFRNVIKICKYIFHQYC